MKELFTLFLAGILCAGNINTDAADFVIHGDNLQIETPEDPPLKTMIILNYYCPLNHNSPIATP